MSDKPDSFVPAGDVLRVWDMNSQEVALWKAAKYRSRTLIRLLREIVKEDALLLERLKEIE
jgi:hypothetical protein